MTLFCGYDIETEGDQEAYALQPWRVREGTARITLSAAYCQGRSKIETEYHDAFVQELRALNTPVVGHNILFDLAFLYASGVNIRGVKWMDSMLLWKWLDNGQDMPMSWSLKSATKRFLKDWPKQEEFLSLKEEELPDPSDPYWRRRVLMDSEATALIAEKIWPQLTPQQQNLAIIQSLSLPMVAISYVHGIRINIAAVDKARPGIIKEMLTQERKLGLLEPESIDPLSPDGTYIPSKILRSPIKMRKLLYEDYNLPCTIRTDKGAESTNKTALTYLSDIDDRVLDILVWRKGNTILSKFTDSPKKVCEYLQSDVTHAAPRMFATYTGRSSFSSKIGKAPCGVANHQIPRDKAVRSYILPHEGDFIVEVDASNQESRLMAVAADDRNMQDVFNSDHPDLHSYTGSQIAGIPYEEFIERKKNNDPEITGSNGYRALGKFCNLAYNYRSSPATARKIARVQYGLDVTVQDTTNWKNTFTSAYPGIKKYWESAPRTARALGYAETIAGRRYKLTRWRDLEWATSSSAINFKIQGSGADMKELAAAVLITKMPELEERLLMELHDAFYFSIPKNYPVKFLQKMVKVLDTIDYKSFWGVDIPIPLVWECSAGPNMGNKAGVGYKDNPDITIEKLYNDKIKC